MHSLTTSEARQVAMGKIQTTTALLLSAAAATRGAAASLEHPDDPIERQPESASCWRLPEVVRLAALPQSGTAGIHQCTFGAQPQSPKKLLFINAPSPHRLRRHAVTR